MLKCKNVKEKSKNFITSMIFGTYTSKTKKEYFKGRRYPPRPSIYFTARKNSVNICL